ncbi:MAG: tetratricopeptide repeat protein [Candidatus Lokiarchaeota archaeon]|nr:tetratricopeptide repeat protein [Candidatus Lokiarchaeota archaeon]
MEIIDKKIEELFAESEKITFLVGAGCSVDPPSCLPAGREMIEEIVNFICAPSEIQNILKLKDLRFEQLVEIMRKTIDKDLKIIDFYGECKSSNLQHIFLADMIKKGHFVLTTNFDSLIENALQQLGVPNDEILPVITKTDFKKYIDPNDLYQKGKKTIYKIHGSPKNIINPEKNTKKSLIATIQAFGKNKEGLNLFQLYPFQKNLFINATERRSLVIIGYSGMDDFDIIPTLLVLKNIKNLIWINYISDNDGIGKIYKIDSKEPSSSTSKKVDQILHNLYHRKVAQNIYKIDVNTSLMIRNMSSNKNIKKQDTFSITPKIWLKQKFQKPDQFRKYANANLIYQNFSQYNDSLRCSRFILEFSNNENNKYWKSIALRNIGHSINNLGQNLEALAYYERALEIYEELSDKDGIASCMNDIAWIYKKKGKYSEALHYMEKALKIVSDLGNSRSISVFLNSIGDIYRFQGEYKKALKNYKQALIITEKLSDLHNKSVLINNIGNIYKFQHNLDKALEQYKISSQIFELLGNLEGYASCLSNIGEILYNQKKYSESLLIFEKALDIANLIDNISLKAEILNDLGLVYEFEKGKSEALKMYKMALEIDEQLDNSAGKAIRLNNIGSYYYIQYDYFNAIEYFKKALEINKQIGAISEQLKNIDNIGKAYVAIGQFNGAISMFENALRINNQIEDLIGAAIQMENLGRTYMLMGNISKAMSYLNKASQIFKKLNTV